MAVSYETRSDEGAILVTEGEVLHYQATPVDRLCEWFVQNGKLLLEKFPRANKKGFWIVSKTYTVPKRALALMLSQGSTVSLGVNAQLETVGRIEATTAWMNSDKGDAWNTHEDVSFGLLPEINHFSQAQYLTAASAPVREDCLLTCRVSVPRSRLGI